MLDHTGFHPDSNPSILEAGCGTAMYAIALSLLGFSVHAFDYNNEALDIGRYLMRKVRSNGHSISLRLYQDNLLSVRSPSDTYDLVFNQAVLEYFCDEDERKKALSEIVRVTRPGGWVAVIVQHTDHPFQRLWEKMGWPGYVNQPPVTTFTPARLSEELRQAELSNISVDGIYPWKAFFFWPPWYQRWKWTHDAIYVLGRMLSLAAPLPCILRRHLAIQILAVGRKQ